MRILLLSCMCLMMWLTVVPTQAQNYWPTKSWRRTTPAAVGLDEAPLAAFDHDLASGKYPLADSMLVVRCGEVAYQRNYKHDYEKIYFKQAHTRGPLNARLTGPYNYFDPAWHPYYHGTDEHSMQSVSKTITSATLGVAVARGDFRAGLDTPILKYFDPARVAHLDDRKRRMTLRDVLTMTTGLDWNEDTPYNDPTNACSLMEATEDWVQFVIDRPMSNEPGKVFAYSSGATELLAYIFQKETGQDIEQYASKYLFAPLGIEHHYWKRTPKGVVDTEGGLYLEAQDLAKIGYLYLNEGRWAGKQIVTQNWVRESLAPRVDAGDGWKYGYQWWLLPAGTPQRLVWMARGFGGQRLFVIPEENLILVFTAWDILGNDSFDEREALRRLLPAVHPHSCSEQQP